MDDRPIRRHFVTKKPETNADFSRVLCVLEGDTKMAIRPGVRPAMRHAWSTNRGKVTCPRCLEWLHA